MRCEAFENRLNVLLDRHEPPENDALLSEHAAACAPCRDMLDAQAGLFDTVRDWSVANLEVDLVDRVLAKVRPAPVPPMPSPGNRVAGWFARGSYRWLGLSVAAVIVVSFTAWQLSRPGEVADTAGQPVTSPQIAAVETPDVTAASGAEFTEAEMAELRNRLAQRASELGRLAENIELPETVTAGLQPFRHTMAAALDALRRTLPSKPEQPATRSSSGREVSSDLSQFA